MAKNQQRNLLTSLVLVVPLFIIYQVGVLFTLPMLNGADFVTTLLLRDLHLSIPAYLAFVGGVVVVFLVGLSRLKKRQHFQTGVIVPVLLESTIYALTMGSLIVLVMTELFRFSPGLAGGVAGSSVLGRLVMSIGAGLYEETVFRLGLLTGLVAIFERALGWRRWIAVMAAFLASSFLFSAMHHIPPHGDPLSLGVFTFRLLAGVFFGLLFWFRGFAVAVYTHAIYDVYVLLIR
ncbi:MAG: CPBP family intramembrane glutamic endopeptidase [Deltaproteobacteria bacterium]|nr:CPBP family intramembrane glutamic endopeptidase [Deltaproteobacteria bacterium]